MAGQLVEDFTDELSASCCEHSSGYISDDSSTESDLVTEETSSNVDRVDNVTSLVPVLTRSKSLSSTDFHHKYSNLIFKINNILLKDTFQDVMLYVLTESQRLHKRKEYDLATMFMIFCPYLMFLKKDFKSARKAIKIVLRFIETETLENKNYLKCHALTQLSRVEIVDGKRMNRALKLSKQALNLVDGHAKTDQALAIWAYGRMLIYFLIEKDIPSESLREEAIGYIRTAMNCFQQEFDDSQCFSYEAQQRVVVGHYAIALIHLDNPEEKRSRERFIITKVHIRNAEQCLQDAAMAKRLGDRQKHYYDTELYEACLHLRQAQLFEQKSQICDTDDEESEQTEVDEISREFCSRKLKRCASSKGRRRELKMKKKHTETAEEHYAEVVKLLQIYLGNVKDFDLPRAGWAQELMAFVQNKSLFIKWCQKQQIDRHDALAVETCDSEVSNTCDKVCLTSDIKQLAAITNNEESCSDAF